MSVSDEEFLNEFKPLHVPPYFNPADSKQDQVVYALAQIGSGSAEDVILELSRHGSSVDPVPYLEVLFDKGLIRGKLADGVMQYDLAKEITPNDGKA